MPVLALIRYRGVWLRGSVLFFSAVLWDRFAEIGALHRLSLIHISEPTRH